VTSNTRNYGHFCMLAAALERVGDRWTLLVIRDLIGGPRRFTDLMERLGGITPKTLSQRLRDLEADGLIEADREAGRREVWYRLSPEGQDLWPALEELLVWGLRHSARPWQPGEPAHPEHLLLALRTMLDREDLQLGPVRWVFQFADDDSYSIRNDEGRWTLTRGEVDAPDIIVTTSRDAWARFLTTPLAQRAAEQPDTQFAGSRHAIRAFMNAIEAFPYRGTTAA